jgi:hypothetical protein
MIRRLRLAIWPLSSQHCRTSRRSMFHFGALENAGRSCGSTTGRRDSASASIASFLVWRR